LESFGYRAKTAAHGVEGLAVFAEFKHEIALVLTDIMMPVMDGFGMIQVMRKMNPTIPIFAASGLAENGKLMEQVGSEVSLFLPKPYTAETLLKALGNELHGSDG
jgi:two-component system cell cycle sensor histidine kinase/response regulator CckA